MPSDIYYGRSSEYLNEREILPAYVGKNYNTDADTAAGQFNLVFISPELLVGIKINRETCSKTDVYCEYLIGAAICLPSYNGK